MTYARENIVGHMVQFGLHTLGRAVYDATFSELGRPFAHQMAITMAAHGAEVIVKARIAEAHPLLMFTKLPSAGSTQGHLGIEDLLRNARSVAYKELPDRLWAADGYMMDDKSRKAFLRFGELRNEIVHLGWRRNIDASESVLRFAFEVVEPMLIEFWGESVVPYAKEWDPEIADDELQKHLFRLNIAPPELTREHLWALLSQPEDYVRPKSWTVSV